MATISVSGLGSGLDIDSWISKLVAVKQADIDATSNQKTTVTNSQTELNSVKSDFSNLLNSIQDLTDSNYGTGLDLFARKNATSSNSTVATATVTSSAAAQNVALSVTQLATSTVAQSSSSVASAINENTKISSINQGAIDAGSFNIYLNNKKYSINVASDSTLGDVLSSIHSATGLTATVNNGKVAISSGTPSDSIVVGSGSDTSDFANVLGLTKQEDGSYLSSKTSWAASTTEALTGANAGFAGTITTGTFTIGNSTYTIDSSTTMSNLIANINKNTSSGVSAYWDSNAGKLVLTSTTTGATNINIEAGTSNFTDVMGLTNAGNIAANTQALGKNAIVSINGSTVTSTSNSITSDVSGISGLTINIAAAGSSTVSVASDNTDLKTAINSFISNFNTTVSTVDTDTSATGKLNGEISLSSIRDKLRTQVSDTYGSSSKYDSLQSIGISTGAVGASINADTNKLYFDESTFDKAMADDPEAVRNLLIGTTSTSNDGALSSLTQTVNASLDSTNGYFATRNDSYTKEVTSLTDKISEQTDALTSYKTRITAQFQAMDEAISKMKSSLTYMTSFLTSTSSSSSNSSSSSSSS